MSDIWFKAYTGLMMVCWIIEWFIEMEGIVCYALPILLAVCLGVQLILEKIDKLLAQLKRKEGEE